MIKWTCALLCFFPLLVFSQVQVSASNPGKLADIMLPKNYKIEVYAQGVTDAREMDFSEDGTLFIGSWGAGKVYAIRPDRSVTIIDEGLDMPAGLDYYNGDLYVAETSRIIKYENIFATMGSSPEPVVINDYFPKDTMPGLKFIRVGPDGKLYIPVGADCNHCIPDTVWHARIMRMSEDGKELEYYAEGVRNAGGFDWNPASGVLWFTDIGEEDNDDGSSSNELNKAPVSGEHFGFPYFKRNMIDKEFWPKRPKNKVFQSPAMKLPDDVVPLGMRFYTGKMFDKKYRGGIFIAEHGSAGHASKAGCRISYVSIKDDRPTGYEVFAAGWTQGDKIWGRPADVQVGPDGSLFISDELAGCVYRIYK